MSVIDSATSSPEMAHVQQDIEIDRLCSSSCANTPSYAAEQQETVEEIEQISLPPTDRGKEAWLVLAGCSLIQIPVWGTYSLHWFLVEVAHDPTGYSLAFGVFQEYYGSHPDKLVGDSSNVAVIGTTMTVRQLMTKRKGMSDRLRVLCTLFHPSHLQS